MKKTIWIDAGDAAVRRRSPARRSSSPSARKAPEFSLVNAVDGKTVTMKPDDGQLKVVIFTCNQCPYAKAFEPRIIEIAPNVRARRACTFYAVNPNDDTKYSRRDARRT